jgi:CRP/FNR family cyclic AMP-dependent transcriptional regulator
MHEALTQSELFQDLSGEAVRRLAAIGRTRSLDAGEYLFLLGDSAEYLYVVVKGKVDLCCPVPLRGAVKDVPVESMGAGKLLGWSTVVRPYRFTLSARAAEPSEVVGFPRQSLLELFQTAPEIGYGFFTKLSELVGIRLLTFQALWVRELQRALLAETEHMPR